jgi:hypothetical protein
MAWKVFTLYRLLGGRKKDIDFWSLSVWTLSSPTWANWRLGTQIKEFDRTSCEFTQSVADRSSAGQAG